MRREKIFTYVSITTLVIFFIIQVYAYMYAGENTSEIKQIALVVYGDDESRWESLQNGAEQACGTAAEIERVTIAENENAMDQMALLQRELDLGVDGLMIAACDSDSIKEYWKAKKTDIPIVFVENGPAESAVYPTFSADNYEMAASLARTICQEEKPWIKVAIVEDGMERQNVRERLQGVFDTMTAYAESVVLWKRLPNETSSSTVAFLQRALTEEAVDVVVTLDNRTTDAMTSAIENLNKEVKLYAIANSDQAVYYLDHNKIRYLAFQDEFSIGYLGAKAILEDNEEMPKPVEYAIVNRAHMYDHDYEKILFPFVK